MDVNVFPSGNGVDVNVSRSNGNIHGSGTVHLPSGEIHSGSAGISGDLGSIDVGHNFVSDRTNFSVSNSDGSLRGNIQYDGNTDTPSFSVTAKSEF